MVFAELPKEIQDQVYRPNEDEVRHVEVSVNRSQGFGGGEVTVEE